MSKKIANDSLIIGIDSGTSIVKAVAFNLSGQQIAIAEVRNKYHSNHQGHAEQSMLQTWSDCIDVLKNLSSKVDRLANRTVAVSVTAQGDGTWLVGKDDVPIGDAWIWLDARSAGTVTSLTQKKSERCRFENTGTGLNTCQQGVQMAHMHQWYPERLKHAEVTLHCKDWLYLKLTGVRATDPSEASFTFGNFRTRLYDDQVIDSLGLSQYKHLLPDIIDGTQLLHPLTNEAAKSSGLLAGTPVCLGYVDMAMTALGGGVYAGNSGVKPSNSTACSIIGSTGVHLWAKNTDSVYLNQQGTGYIIPLPIPDIVTQVQTNMASALNIDWILNLAADLLSENGQPIAHSELITRIDGWLAKSTAGGLLYQPYISEAGERGPFVNAHARASFIGLSSQHRFADMVRSVLEGLALATRDCYQAMGALPQELIISGGAARSNSLQNIIASTINAPVRMSTREEAGAAGAAMMAAVAIGAYSSMDECIKHWVTPFLAPAVLPTPSLNDTYEKLYPLYQDAHHALTPLWSNLSQCRNQTTIKTPLDGTDKNNKQGPLQQPTPPVKGIDK